MYSVLIYTLVIGILVIFHYLEIIKYHNLLSRDNQILNIIHNYI